MATFDIQIKVADDEAAEISGLLRRGFFLAVLVDYDVETVLVYDPTRDPNSGVFEDPQTVTPEDVEDMEAADADLAAGHTTPLSALGDD